MNMGKYGEALGIWELRVGGAELDLKPKHGDNKKLMGIMTEAKKRNDEAFLMNEIGKFVQELISRDYPPLTDIEKVELEEYIEFNVLELMKELLIKFRWTTKDKWDETESVLKKETLPGFTKGN